MYGDNDKYIKTKIKIYDNNVNTNFHVKKYQKKMHHINVMLDSVVKVKKEYYPQLLLEECKCEIKKTKMVSFINNEFEPSSSGNESDNESDNETDNKSDN